MTTLKDTKLNTIVKMKPVGISSINTTPIQTIGNITPINPVSAVQAVQNQKINNISNMSVSDTKNAISNISVKLKNMKKELNFIFLEREEVINDIFNCLIANQNILLLGPPGTGKSALAEEITSRIVSARIFKWLLNRTSDPSEILGPISIKGMEQDQFIRKLDGKIADCEVAFLDEIFKCNEPTLNALLPIMNEKIIYNNGKPIPIPLKMVIAASNETPEEEELGALYDRILIKHWVEYIQDPSNREEMLKRYNGKKNNSSKTLIDIGELDFLQNTIKHVEIPDSIMTSYGNLLNKLSIAGFKFSDRKINWATDLIKANALVNGRIICEDEDLFAVTYAFWENRDDVNTIKTIIGKSINPDLQLVKDLNQEATDIFNAVKKTYKRDKQKGTEEAIEAKQKIEIILNKINNTISKLTNNKNLQNFVKIRNDIMDRCNKMVSAILNINMENLASNDEIKMPF